MPFKKELYPSNWKEISLLIRERAGQKCEICGVANGAIGARAIGMAIGTMKTPSTK